MPKKSSTPVVAAVSAVASASANDEPANISLSMSTDTLVDTPVNTKTKKEPVKRVSKKTKITDKSLPDTTTTPVQINDNVNTFKINITHIKDDNVTNVTNVTNAINIDNENGSGSVDAATDNSVHKYTYQIQIQTNDDDNEQHGEDNSEEDNEDNSEEDNESPRRVLPAPAPTPTALAHTEDANPLYTLKQINYDILIPFVLINMHASSRENILALLHTTLISCIEGRCITEGYIKPCSTRIIDFKCGKIIAKNVQFNIVIECLVCNPPDHSIISCIAKNITQAGIRAVSEDEYSPVVVYITRDFGLESDKTYYNSIKEGDKINIRIIGKRFEMNDKNIQIIGFLVQPKKERGLLYHKKTAPVTLSSLQSNENNSKTETTTTTTTTTSLSKSRGGGSGGGSARSSRGKKNPLNIINDTDNNVITITYDANIELPKQVKAPKKSKVSKDTSNSNEGQ